MQALADRGIPVCNTAGADTGGSTAELAVGLMLAGLRHMAVGDRTIRAGGFQGGVPTGRAAEGLTLGVIGLGRIGARVARVARAMDMRVLAWSQNLTVEAAAAAAAGAERVEKGALLAASDVISLHLVLSPRSRGIVGAAEIAQMKPGALLVNTSRGPLVDEPALIAALLVGRISAALDVFAEEPLPPGHPLRTAPHTVLTPHLGYVVQQIMPTFYRHSIENILAFLDGRPIRVINDPKRAP
jgi:phosphoglycerate dehydrogenase-like enzyme